MNSEWNNPHEPELDDDRLSAEEKRIIAAHKELIKPIKTQAERDKAQLDKFLKNHPQARKQYQKRFPK